MAKTGEFADESKKMGSGQHKVVITERESLTIDGVTNVESFDEGEVVLETTAGLLYVRGRDLHINQLNLEDGSLEIEGYVDSLDYTDEGTGRRRGFWGRILK